MPYLSLPFIQGKIVALQNALFFSLSDSPLKMTTCVVSIIKVDAVGQIWFTVARPSQFIYTFDSSFPAKLDFFKKGQTFYLKILGKAYIVNDPEEINSILDLNEEMREKAMKNDIVLMKVRISHADYFEKEIHPEQHSFSLKSISSRIYKRFFNPRQYNLSAFKEFPVNGIMSTDQAFSH